MAGSGAEPSARGAVAGVAVAVPVWLEAGALSVVEAPIRVPIPERLSKGRTVGDSGRTDAIAFDLTGEVLAPAPIRLPILRVMPLPAVVSRTTRSTPVPDDPPTASPGVFSATLAERVDSRMTTGRLRVVTVCAPLAAGGSDPIRLPSTRLRLRLLEAGESTAMPPGLVVRELATLDTRVPGVAVTGVDRLEPAGPEISEDRL